MNKLLLLVLTLISFQVTFAQQNFQKKLFPEHNSDLNIPFTHSSYAELDYYYNKGENSHTASKPYSYNDAAFYVNLNTLKTPLLKDKASKANGWNSGLSQNLTICESSEFDDVDEFLRF